MTAVELFVYPIHACREKFNGPLEINNMYIEKNASPWRMDIFFEFIIKFQFGYRYICILCSLIINLTVYLIVYLFMY